MAKPQDSKKSPHKKKLRRPVRKNPIGPVDTQWFKNLLSQRGLSLRQAAKILDRNVGHLSFVINAKRRLSLDESVMLAKALQVPHSELLSHFGVNLDDTPPHPKSSQLPLSGSISGPKLQVIWNHVQGPKSAPCPFPDVDLRVLRCQTAGTPYDGLDGALVYFRDSEAKGVDAEAIGHPCLVRISGQDDALYLRIPRRGYVRGRFNLTALSGEVLEQDVGIERTLLVAWMAF